MLYNSTNHGVVYTFHGVIYTDHDIEYTDNGDDLEIDQVENRFMYSKKNVYRLLTRTIILKGSHGCISRARDV